MTVILDVGVMFLINYNGVYLIDIWLIRKVFLTNKNGKADANVKSNIVRSTNERYLRKKVKLFHRKVFSKSDHRGCKIITNLQHKFLDGKMNYLSYKRIFSVSSVMVFYIQSRKAHTDCASFRNRSKSLFKHCYFFTVYIILVNVSFVDEHCPILLEKLE